MTAAAATPAPMKSVRRSLARRPRVLGDDPLASMHGRAYLYQWTPFMRFAIATCSMEAFSLGSFWPRADRLADQVRRLVGRDRGELVVDLRRGDHRRAHKLHVDRGEADAVADH